VIAVVKSNSVTVNVSSSTSPPPSSYTCWVPKCKTIILNGKSVSVCEPVGISSSSPCPNNNTGGYSSKSEACANITCGSGSAEPVSGYSGGTL